MAQTLPRDVDASMLEHAAEAETVRALAEQLPGDWWVVHGCHWTLPRSRGICQGEIDIVVVSPSGALVLIEQKNGAIEVEGGDYIKRYGDKAKSVSRQMGRNRDLLMQKAQRDGGLPPVGVTSVLYFPDSRVTQLRGAGLDAMTVVDHDGAPELAPRIQALAGHGEADPERARDIVRFLGGELGLAPSLHALGEASERARIHLSGPFAGLLEGFEMHPMRLRIEACAGSGKSEFILRLARRLGDEGRRTLVTCYNRPLSALLRATLAERVQVDTYLGVLRHLAEDLGLSVAMAEAQSAAFWTRIEQQVQAAIARNGIPAAWRFEAVLVDEAQDLGPHALALLQQLAGTDGDFVWVGDPAQNLRGEPMAAPEGFATFRINQNYRTPRAIAEEIREIAPAGVEFMNPVSGTGVEVHACTTDTLPTAAAEAVDALLARGYAYDDLLLLTLESSRSLDWATPTLGRHRTRWFTGRYDEDGNQILTDGDLMIESVRRAKGQQRPHVIVAGVDLERVTEPEVKRALYVALTRATVGATLLRLTEPANVASGHPATETAA